MFGLLQDLPSDTKGKVINFSNVPLNVPLNDIEVPEKSLA
jgi:hypothetical protein